MRRLIEAFCILVTVLLLMWALSSHPSLPPETDDLVSQKYAGWSGVLRIWAYEGWTGREGAFSGWLNRCASIYEKQNEGVYVQIRYVDPSAILSIEESGVRPPDVILFPPGLIEDASFLAQLPQLPVRSGLAARADSRAIPVAMGAYLLISNPDMPPSGVTSAAVPCDEPFRCFSAASLSMRMHEAEAPSDEPAVPPGLDLGLPASGTALPPVLRAADAADRFADGSVSSAVVTQREILHLQNLYDQGHAPAWRTDVSCAGFTDQLLLLGIVESGTERQALSVRFAQHLLSDSCQTLLASCNAFNVIDAPTGYPSAHPLAATDAVLHEIVAVTPPAFNNQWRTICSELYKNDGSVPNDLPGLPAELFGGKNS